MNTDISLLTSEYQTLLSELKSRSHDDITDALVADHDWTEAGASELAMVVKNYGAFFLRNAAALAIATGQEDGDLSF
ncbi:hypothetical protein LF1_11540 [Rubripirellula obstinata]|uniref:Uncharacterized protein n=1 Tax=Rubripirellula obstinata TaxID=406547 RepID=A0A5B1CEI4_9BACT|nr:hypothetical protein [Rubripirellula obstinata]KAA1258632.1 hypothetical protein LF1_11540 [Rubripirellula obstinata]